MPASVRAFVGSSFSGALISSWFLLDPVSVGRQALSRPFGASGAASFLVPCAFLCGLAHLFDAGFQAFSLPVQVGAVAWSLAVSGSPVVRPQLMHFR